MKRGVATAFAAALLGAGCDGDADAGVFGDAQLVDELDGYTDWGAPAGWEGLARSCEGAHGAFVRLYANEVAASALGAGEAELPVGALLVNASFQDTDETPKLLGAMRKVALDGPEAARWYWGLFDDDGAFVLGGAIQACARCHAQSADFLRHRDGPPPAPDEGCAGADTGGDTGGDTGVVAPAR